jgi:hypothetical protein
MSVTSQSTQVTKNQFLTKKFTADRATGKLPLPLLRHSLLSDDATVEVLSLRGRAVISDTKQGSGSIGTI